MSQKMRVLNSSAYNTFLKNRGKIFSLIKNTCPIWYAKGIKKQRGGNYQYSDALILTMYTVSYLTSSALRQTVGIFEDYIELCKLALSTPNFSTLSRRLKKLDVKILDHRQSKSDFSDVEIIIDSSTINMYNTGGGHSKANATHRSYKHYAQVRKMHVALDLDYKDVLSFSYGQGASSDHLAVKELIDSIDTKHIKTLRADRAYDRLTCYKLCYDHNIQPIIPPIRVAAIKDGTYFQERNRVIQEIALHGRYEDGLKQWKLKVGYGLRSYVEGFFSRFKRIFGFSFKNKTEQNRANELKIKCNILNYFNSIGRAKFILTE